MKEKIKKIFPVFLLIIAIVFPLVTDARSGCCSWHGGVCGCQCCDGTSLSSTCLPYYPECGGGFYSPPSYDYTPSIPDCPLNSYYDSIYDTCKCYSGYIVSGGKCISSSQYCWDLFGYNASYNILTNSCECGYGYVLSGGGCVDGDTLCHQKYGYDSDYDSLSESCKCDYGYRFDSNNQCVSNNEYCQGLYGYNAEHNILKGACVCKKGYFLNSSLTSCIDGDAYCKSQYGIYATYDNWSEQCKCDTGYVISGNKCVDEDVYCQNLYGSNSSYNSILKKCDCNNGYELKNGKCVTPQVTSIFPLEVKIGEEVTVKGENFGDSKYGDLELYIGSTKVNSLDISKWQDDKIIFEAGDYLDSGNLILKDDFVNIRGSYLEISEAEEEKTPQIYSFTPPTQEVVTKKEFQPSNETSSPKTTQIQNETQPEVKTQLPEKSQTLETQEQETQKQEEQTKFGEEKKQGNPVWMFLASIFDTIKNFFVRLF